MQGADMNSSGNGSVPAGFAAWDAKRLIPEPDGGAAGRVLQARTGSFAAGCFTLECAPPFGALVVVQDGETPLYGVVGEVRTEGRDPGRHPALRGEPAQDRAAVLANNPQIPQLLQTTFEVVVAGHGQPGRIRQELPAAPAPIFARVRECTAAEASAFAASSDFLRLLLAGGAASDEMTAACLRRLAAAHADGRAFLVRAGKALAGLLAAEPERLVALLGRIRP